MTKAYKIEDDHWFKVWTAKRIEGRKKRVEHLLANLDKPPHSIEVAHLKRWMKYSGCKTLTELVTLREKHLNGGKEATQLGAFVKKLGKDGVSESVIGRATSTIRGFYRDIGLPLSEFHRASRLNR